MRGALLAGVAVSIMACASVSQNKMEPEPYFEGTSLALARSIQQNRLDEVERLARQVELNRFYKADMTPLVWAMLVDREEAFRLLLKLGANPNLKDHDNIQPVALAAGASDDNKYLKILLQQGGDPNSWQRTKPALHVAFDRDYNQNVALLLNAGGDVNSRDKDGLTLLNSAGYLQDFPMALEFIRRGADVAIPTKNGGGIALSVQESMPQRGSASYKAQIELKKLLLERGVKFPIFHPSASPYAALLEQWHQTPEGRQWQQKLEQLGQDPMGVGDVWKEADDAAFASFKAWMKANRIAEPDRPRPQPSAIDLN